MSRAVRIDTVTFTDDFDFHQFVRSVLAGEPVVGGLPTDSGHLDWWDRAWPLIADSGFEPRVADALVQCLTDKDPMVRGSAISVLEKHTAAVSAETIDRLLRDQPSLFAGVKCPWQRTVDLKWMLLRVLGAMMEGSTAEGKKATEIGKRLALSDVDATGPLAAGLTRTVPEWAVEHAVDLAGGSSSTAVAILFNLQDDARLLHEAAITLGRVFGKDRRFREEIKNLITDPDTRAAIFAGRD